MGAARCADEKVVAGVQDVVVCGGRHCVVGGGLWVYEEIIIMKSRWLYGIYVKMYVYIMLDVEADDDEVV